MTLQHVLSFSTLTVFPSVLFPSIRLYNVFTTTVVINCRLLLFGIKSLPVQLNCEHVWCFVNGESLLGRDFLVASARREPVPVKKYITYLACTAKATE